MSGPGWVQLLSSKCNLIMIGMVTLISPTPTLIELMKGFMVDSLLIIKNLSRMPEFLALDIIIKSSCDEFLPLSCIIVLSKLFLFKILSNKKKEFYL